jgi:hypothetical protein
VAPSFPESARDGEEFLQIFQDKLFLIQIKRRLRKYSLWAILDLISHILIFLCILTKMWSLLP